MLWKLIQGLLVTSRNTEIKSTSLQFLERYPKSPHAADVELELAKVLDGNGQRREAADHYRASWERRGVAGVSEAARAFRLYEELRSEATAKIMGEMALSLLDQLPANVSAVQFGMMAVYQTRNYGSQYALSNQVGTKMLQKNLPFDENQKWEIHYWMGDSSRSQQQHANAIQSYRAALGNGADDPEVSRNLIRSLKDGQAPFAELQAAVEDYFKRFPLESPARRAEMSMQLAYAKHDGGDVPAALSLLQQTLRRHCGSAYTLFSWTGDESLWPKAESIYRDVAAADPAEAYRLHYSAAFSHFRDRRKDNAKAADVLRQHLLYPAALPNAGSEFRDALAWVLGTAASDEAFQKEVQRHLAHARVHPDNTGYGRALEGWLGEAKKSKDETVRKRYRIAQGEYEKFRNDASVRLWEKALETRMRGHQAREQLLGRNDLSDAQRRTLLRLHADDIRSHGDSRRRNEAIPFYQQLALADSNSYAAARPWLECAAHYGDAGQSKAALEHMLRLQQTHRDSAVWSYASAAARKAEDSGLQKRVMQWIRDNQKRVGASNDYANSIVENLRNMEMNDDALAYMRECARRDGNAYDTALMVEGLFRQTEEGAPRIEFLAGFLNPVTDNYGHYASLLANEYLKLGDIGNFERVCAEATKVRDNRLLRSDWNFSLHEWVSDARQHETWTAEQKATVFRVASQANRSRESAVAKLAFLEVAGAQMPPMQRLLAYRETTMAVPRDSTSFSYLFPWAQRALGREEYAEAAALATGLINNIPNAGSDSIASSRSLVRQAYGKMGSLGMQVNADSPVAPLLEIGLHLRLGDRERALSAYTERQKLFDEYLLEIPAELVAFAADSHIAAGGEDNHNRAEEMLRRWLIEFSEKDKFLDSEKARIQLLLAKNYNRSKRYEVARSEYTTVVNRYPETEEAIEARFGIGETLMAQKIFDQAEETFAELAEHPASKVRVRGSFLLGVLASQKGDSSAAREIFKEVLGSMPDIALANETLYHLAEVYGGEQRFLDQLELLRAVGRLGQTSKRWHEPGAALSIVVQDSDLGISRGHAKIPVELVTHPGGDREQIFISSGGAGKGLFIGEIETVLGAAIPGNGVVEVSGGDLVSVDYPAEFKQEFRFQPLATEDIGMAADAKFAMASARIVDEEEETETERLEREMNERGEADRRQIGETARFGDQARQPDLPAGGRFGPRSNRRHRRGSGENRRVQRRRSAGRASRNQRPLRCVRRFGPVQRPAGRRIGHGYGDRTQCADGHRQGPDQRVDQSAGRPDAEVAFGRSEGSEDRRPGHFYHAESDRPSSCQSAASGQPRRSFLVSTRRASAASRGGQAGWRVSADDATGLAHRQGDGNHQLAECRHTQRERGPGNQRAGRTEVSLAAAERSGGAPEPTGGTVRRVVAGDLRSAAIRGGALHHARRTGGSDGQQFRDSADRVAGAGNRRRCLSRGGVASVGVLRRFE